MPDPSLERSSRGGHLLANAVRFARLLRGLGLEVTPEQEATAAAALCLVDLRRRDEVRDALRSVLVNRGEDRDAFDAAFAAFWRPGIAAAGARLELGRLLARSHEVRRRVLRTLYDPPGSGSGGGEDERLPLVDRRGTASDREVLRHKDFAELTAAEEEEVRRLIHGRAFRMEQRRTRRREPARHGAELDLRRSLRRSLASGGELVRPARRRRRRKPRPLVMLCDVSGSMESYSRILLQFLYAAGQGRPGRGAAGRRGRREAFAFGTRLTRITRPLRHRDVDRALREATAAVVDWGGGTRIGEVLGRFNRDWAGRVLSQGAVVMIISDGWDRGEPQALAREMARLRRTSDRLIWLNPLLGSEGYEPLARGMAAALPFVDDFLAIHNLESLEQLGRLLEGLERRRPAAAEG